MIYELVKSPDPGFDAERTATSPSLNDHLDSMVGRTATSNHPAKEIVGSTNAII